MRQSDGFSMINKRFSLAFLTAAAGLTIAASPAQAETYAVPTDTIDVAEVAAPAAGEGDAHFSQLFAQWENPRDSLSAIRPQVSVPSRMPLENARLTSAYGMRTHPVLNRRMGHKSIDLAAPTGTPIYATADGVVSQAEWFGAYGNYVAVEHGARIQTRYAHMSEIVVADDARV